MRGYKISPLHRAWVIEARKDRDVTEICTDVFFSHLAMRQPVEAAKLLSRRTDLSALKTATHVTLAANEIGDARVHGHKYIQQCLLKCDWASAFDLVQLHGCFKVLR